MPCSGKNKDGSWVNKIDGIANPIALNPIGNNYEVPRFRMGRMPGNAGNRLFLEATIAWLGPIEEIL